LIQKKFFIGQHPVTKAHNKVKNSIWLAMTMLISKYLLSPTAVSVKITCEAVNLERKPVSSLMRSFHCRVGLTPWILQCNFVI